MSKYDATAGVVTIAVIVGSLISGVCIFGIVMITYKAIQQRRKGGSTEIIDEEEEYMDPEERKRKQQVQQELDHQIAQQIQEMELEEERQMQAERESRIQTTKTKHRMSVKEPKLNIFEQQQDETDLHHMVDGNNENSRIQSSNRNTRTYIKSNSQSYNSGEQMNAKESSVFGNLHNKANIKQKLNKKSFKEDYETEEIYSTANHDLNDKKQLSESSDTLRKKRPQTQIQEAAEEQEEDHDNIKDQVQFNEFVSNQKMVENNQEEEIEQIEMKEEESRFDSQIRPSVNQLIQKDSKRVSHKNDESTSIKNIKEQLEVENKTDEGEINQQQEGDEELNEDNSQIRKMFYNKKKIESDQESEDYGYESIQAIDDAQQPT